jgi:hypothetical protein
LNSLLKIGYAAVLLAATFVLTWVPDYVNEGAWFAAMGIGYIAFYLLLVSALVMLIAERPLNKVIRTVCLAWVAIVLLVIVILGYGFAKDMIGMHCSGFFGATTSCASNQYLIVLLLLFHPYSIFAWMGLSILGLLVGWYKYLGGRSLVSRPK